MIYPYLESGDVQRMLWLCTLAVLATSSASPQCEANSLLQHTARELKRFRDDDPSICRNPRKQQCDIFWNAFSSDAAETSCGLGALCMTTGVGLPNICKCQMGFVCGPDGSCRARTAQDVARHFDTFEEKETPETPVRNGTCPCPW
eukprot:symbB.v1.2.019363.t1/scaffold1564.1/size111405/14